MPSCQSAGTMPDLQTWINRVCKVRLTRPRAHFSSSGGIPSEPAAWTFFSILIAQMTSSSTVGSLVLTFGSWTAEMDSDSRHVEVVAGMWLRAAVKCSDQRCIISSLEWHGLPSTLWMQDTTGWECFWPTSVLMAQNADLLLLCWRSSSTSFAVRER